MNTKTNPLQAIWDLLSNPLVQSVIGFLILMVVCVTAYYLLSKLRDSNSNNQLDLKSLEKNFEEMRSGGDINEAEFRNIKALLATSGSKSVMSTHAPLGPRAKEASQKDAESDA